MEKVRNVSASFGYNDYCISIYFECYSRGVLGLKDVVSCCADGSLSYGCVGLSVTGSFRGRHH